MAAAFLATTQLTATTTLADFGPLGAAVATPAGKNRTLWLRACNIGALDASADVFIVDTVTGANSGYRAKNYPITYNTKDSAPDFEQKLVLTPNLKVQIRASANSTIAFSGEWVEE